MIYAIFGPTASSKTSYSIKLAKKLNAEVINVDAYSIYKDMDIISAKVTDEEMQGVKHYFVSHYYINENIDVKRFQEDVRAVIDKLTNENKDIILVGGSNMYMFSILFKYDFKEVSYDYEKYDSYSDEDVTKRLSEVDYDYIELSQNNRRRMIKAILYFETFNEQYSKKEVVGDELFYNNVKFIYLRWDREVLYQRINKRVDKMYELGIEKEFEYLSDNYDHNTNAFKAIGCKEFIEYDNENHIKAMIKQNSRRLAKRQISWINNKLIKNSNIDLEIIDYK